MTTHRGSFDEVFAALKRYLASPMAEPFEGRVQMRHTSCEDAYVAQVQATLRAFEQPHRIDDHRRPDGTTYSVYAVRLSIDFRYKNDWPTAHVAFALADARTDAQKEEAVQAILQSVQGKDPQSYDVTTAICRLQRMLNEEERSPDATKCLQQHLAELRERRDRQAAKEAVSAKKDMTPKIIFFLVYCVVLVGLLYKIHAMLLADREKSTAGGK